ncbi:MAG: DUF302 domain-containing protein [Rhodobacteraceae bacterium]|nr:DUF302 domain-containing protein [Paracoccaceae bacterium]QEW20707.1 hypothetical protein LA6_002906 [Marinibacterium anthonyi]
MKRTNTAALICAAMTVVTGGAKPAAAEEAITYPADGSFADTAFAVENGIVNRGFVVDHVSHVGDMLNRTAGDVGATEQIFSAADVYLFCSATVSRDVMEVDPMNIVHCPYSIFVTEIDGKVTVGHRDYPDGEMQQVEDLLSEIARDAASGW